MLLGTIAELSDVNGCPSFHVPLDGLVRVGERVGMKFRLTRRHGGRTEMLDVDGDFRVLTVRLALTAGGPRQMLTMEAASGKAPVWKSVKNPAPGRRVLPPARFPRTPLR